MSGISAGAVVTLTPAPTLDRTYYVNNLIEGGVNRAEGVAEELAGKGINVTKGLHLVGINAPGVVPIGNADPGVLNRTGYADTLVPLWIEGTLRVSTTMVIPLALYQRKTGPQSLRLLRRPSSRPAQNGL
jgi:1-phosphofructokinase